MKIKPGALVKWLRGCQRLRQGSLLPSAAVTPAQSAQAVQLWPTKSSRLGTRRSRAAITLTARSRSAIITARQAAYVIFRALDRVGTSCVRAPETPTHILLEKDKSSRRLRESRRETQSGVLPITSRHILLIEWLFFYFHEYLHCHLSLTASKLWTNTHVICICHKKCDFKLSRIALPPFI